jgi:hypothetical protein
MTMEERHAVSISPDMFEGFWELSKAVGTGTPQELIRRVLREHLVSKLGDDYGLRNERLDRYVTEGSTFADPAVGEIIADWIRDDAEGEEWKADNG